jgi:hypothetical protein
MEGRGKDDSCAVTFHSTVLFPWPRCQGAQLITLQRGPDLTENATARDSLSVFDLGDDLDVPRGPFMDTSAIMKNLDLVITSGTSIAHLQEPWRFLYGLRCRTQRIGGGCSSAAITPGIRRCGFFGRRERGLGRCVW